MSEPMVHLDIRPDGLAVLTFDQPGSKANVLSTQMWSDFEAALDELAGRSDVRGLILASAKPGIFMAGADLKLLGSVGGPNDPGVRAFIEQGLRTLAKLEALPVPTCAAIDGAALGGGLEVALACDYRLCGSHPRVELGLPEVKLGLIPGWGGTQRLPRLLGASSALAHIHSGAAITPSELAELGSSDDLLERAGQVLRRGDWRSRRDRRTGPLPPERCLTDDRFANVCTSIPEMYGESVAARLAAAEAIYRGGPLPLAEALPIETELFLRLAGSDESQRLIAAFFASRKK